MWLSPEYVLDPLFTESVSDWLLDQSSLTQKLRAIHGGQFNIKLLNWKQESPMDTELEILSCDVNERAWVREVVLQSGEMALIYARSVMVSNDHTLLKNISNLGERSLGDYLFSAPNVIRDKLELANIADDDALLKPFALAKLIDAKSFWARRCSYKIGLARLLVNEVYSPSVFMGNACCE